MLYMLSFVHAAHCIAQHVERVHPCLKSWPGASTATSNCKSTCVCSKGSLLHIPISGSRGLDEPFLRAEF